jgi:hypothetical protein
VRTLAAMSVAPGNIAEHRSRRPRSHVSYSHNSEHSENGGGSFRAATRDGQSTPTSTMDKLCSQVTSVPRQRDPKTQDRTRRRRATRYALTDTEGSCRDALNRTELRPRSCPGMPPKKDCAQPPRTHVQPPPSPQTAAHRSAANQPTARAQASQAETRRAANGMGGWPHETGRALRQARWTSCAARSQACHDNAIPRRRTEPGDDAPRDMRLPTLKGLVETRSIAQSCGREAVLVCRPRRIAHSRHEHTSSLLRLHRQPLTAPQPISLQQEHRRVRQRREAIPAAHIGQRMQVRIRPKQPLSAGRACTAREDAN